MINRLTLAILVGVSAFQASASSLYLTELNATDVSIAGAGLAARANDATTAFSNPAGMTLLEGSRYEAMAMPIFLSVDFKTDGNNTAQGNTNDANAILPSGSFYYTSKIDDKLAWGVAVVGYFGLGLDYDDEWAGRYMINESLLQSVGIQPAIAYQLTPALSLGVGALIGISKLKQTININNLEPSLDDGLLTLEDEDTYVQFNTGLLYQFSEGTRLGVQYLSEADLEYKKVAKIKGEGETVKRLKEYLGLVGNKTDIDMTLPQMVNVSFYHQVNEKVNLLSNVSWQDWSEFSLLRVDIKTDETLSLAVDKNYQDSLSVSLGMQYQWDDKLILNTGVAYQETMVKDKYRTPDMPLDSSIRVAIGGEYVLDEASSFKFGYGLLFLGDTEIDNEKGPLTGRLSGHYNKLSMHFFSLGYESRF